jgi:hypothetical protein
VNTAYAPALTSGIDTCLGSFSVGAQHTVFGISFGKTTIDDNCVMLKQARMLHEMGLRVAAWQRLCQTKETRQALLDSAEYDCKSTAAQLAKIEEDRQRRIVDEALSEKQRIAAVDRYNKEQEALVAKKKRDEETLAAANRIVIRSEVLSEIHAAGRPNTFGTPTYTEPQKCKRIKPQKKSTVPPCK